MGGYYRSCTGLFPVEAQLSVRRRTIAKVQVYEALVRNTHFFGYRLEVGD